MPAFQVYEYLLVVEKQSAKGKVVGSPAVQTLLTETQRVNVFPSKLGIGLHFPAELYDAQSVVSHFFVASVYLQDLFNPHVYESPEALEQDVNA